MRIDFDWLDFKGRDAEGDRFDDAVLIHSSGRILAKICRPKHPGEYTFQLWFYVSAAKKSSSADCDEGGQDLRFIDEISAKSYAEKLLKNYGEPNKPPVAEIAETVSEPSGDVTPAHSYCVEQADGAGPIDS